MRLEVKRRCIPFPLVIHWSSLRCFYNLIGVHLWEIQLIGHDLERHTPVYIRSHRWQCMSEQKPSHEVERSVHRAPRQDCVEAQIWGNVPKKMQHWRSPRIQWPPSFWNGRSLEPPRLFLEVAAQPNCNRGRRALDREVTKNPMVTLTAL